VRPGTTEDIGLIVNAPIGRKDPLRVVSVADSDWSLQLRELALTRTPFAIKCSSHNTNPGFSPTLGVQISMIKFNDIVIYEDSGTVDIGAVLTWTEVFSHLVPKGINVVGGRRNGVSVGGFTLGGGQPSFQFFAVAFH
jgi:FAD/FMN-containing dehydrogenase